MQSDSRVINGNILGASMSSSVAMVDKAEVQIEPVTGAWDAAILTIEETLDGINWRAIGTRTHTSVGIGSEIDVSGSSRVRARVSTVQGSDLRLRVTISSYDSTGAGNG